MAFEWLKNLGKGLFGGGAGGAAVPAGDPASTASPQSMRTGPRNAADPRVAAAMGEVAAPFVDGPSAQPQVADQEGIRAAGLRTQPANAAQQQGRENRTDWLAVNEFDKNQPAWVRGWLKNERRRVDQGRQEAARTPPGMVMAHGRTTPAREGYDYSNARLQGADLNKLEERVRRRRGVP